MNILYIWYDDYPWDIRVEKFCKTLSKAGHVVHLIATNKKKQARSEQSEFMTIHRLPCCRKNLINTIINFPLFFSPIWLFSILHIIKKYEINTIINRDLPLIISSILCGKVQKIPIIFDMAEVYPEMLRSRFQIAGRISLFDRIVRNPTFAEFVQKIALKHSNKVIVVVKEAQNHITLSNHLVPEFVEISNTPELEFFNNICKKNSFYLRNEKWFKNNFVIVYHGGIRKARGLETVFSAIRLVQSKIPNLKFLVIGRVEQKYKKILSKEDISNSAKFTGWINLKEIPSLLSHCNIGIIPHLKTSHTDTTMPNKIFDYMAIGLPVIVRNTIPLERIVNETNCGFVFSDENDLAKIIEKVYCLKSLEQYINNGKTSVSEKYNWDIDSNKLLRLFE